MDFRLEQWINHPAGHHPPLDTLMVHLASWGEAIFIGVVVVWFLTGWLLGRSNVRREAIMAFIAADLALLLNVVISHIWARPRPFVTHPNSVNVLLSHSTDASFPSDHAVAGFAIGVALFVAHRKLGILALLFAGLMSYARVYVGDHYPSDVIAGAIFGSLIAVGVMTWLNPVGVWIGTLIDNVMRWLHLPMPHERAHAMSRAERS